MKWRMVGIGLVAVIALLIYLDLHLLQAVFVLVIVGLGIGLVIGLTVKWREWGLVLGVVVVFAVLLFAIYDSQQKRHRATFSTPAKTRIVQVGEGANQVEFFFPPWRGLRGVQENASETCQPSRLHALAAALGTRPTPDAVARRYSQYWQLMPLPEASQRVPPDVRQEAMYEGCMEGFSG